MKLTEASCIIEQQPGGTVAPTRHKYICTHTYIYTVRYTGIYLWIHSLTFQCANEEHEGHQMEAGKHFAGSVCVQSLQSNKVCKEREREKVSE